MQQHHTSTGIHFQGPGSRKISANFDGGHITSLGVCVDLNHRVVVAALLSEET